MQTPRQKPEASSIMGVHSFVSASEQAFRRSGVPCLLNYENSSSCGIDGLRQTMAPGPSTQPRALRTSMLCCLCKTGTTVRSSKDDKTMESQSQ
jgi:hypothetical protein